MLVFAPPQKPPENVVALERYKLARGQIEHENTLIGQRITWYLTLQGFLFAALFVALGLLFDTSKFPKLLIARTDLAAAITVLPIVGVFASVACFLLIRSAYAQIDRVVGWWSEQRLEASDFPPITGTGGFSLFRYRVTGADFVLVLLVVWLLFLGLILYAASKEAL